MRIGHVGRCVAAVAPVAALVLGSGVAGAEPVAARKVAFIVPGQQLYGSGAAWESLYGPMRASLEQRGFETHYIDAPGKLLRADAELIRSAVESTTTPADQVAIVGHSVGGVSARYFVKNLDKAGLVDSVVAIGSPQYGSPGGCTQGPLDGYDSCVYSDLFPELNAGDDTPGTALYSVVQSSGEWADGGQCRLYLDGIAASGTGFDHLTELVHPELLGKVADAADGGCPGTFVDEPDGTITWRDTMTPTAPPFA